MKKYWQAAALSVLAFSIPARSALVKPIKAQLVVLEGKSPSIQAQFNPKEITVDKSVDWQRDSTRGEDSPFLEFSAGKARSLSFELLFDTFESKQNVHETFIKNLENLALIDPTLKRPPMVAFVWGSSLPAFKGVIDSISVKYTLFLPEGTPVRATCRVHMREEDPEIAAARAPGGHCHNHILDGDEITVDCSYTCGQHACGEQ